MKEIKFKETFAADIGLTCEGLTCKEELEQLTERFEMTKSQVLKSIIHDIYITGIRHENLQKTLDRAFAKEFDESFLDYNCDGSPIENYIEDDEYDNTPPF